MGFWDDLKMKWMVAYSIASLTVDAYFERVQEVMEDKGLAAPVQQQTRGYVDRFVSRLVRHFIVVFVLAVVLGVFVAEVVFMLLLAFNLYRTARGK